jgi:chromosome partitioning protein
MITPTLVGPLPGLRLFARAPMLQTDTACGSNYGKGFAVLEKEGGKAGSALSSPRINAKRKLWDRWDNIHGSSPADKEKRSLPQASKNSSYVVAVINQKGGTGKTTTTVNLGAALAYLGHRTLMVDLDPQAHTTIGIGVDPDAFIESVAEVMSIPKKSMAEIILPTYIPGLTLAPAHIHLAHVAEQIYTRVYRETILAQALQGLDHEFILIDCPPSLGVLTINALYACDFIIIPCQISRYSLDGLADLLTTIEIVKNLSIQDLFQGDHFRILLTMYDPRNRITNQYIMDELRPYRDKQFTAVIRKNEALNQAQIAQKAIFDYEFDSTGSQDYQRLALEFLQLYHKRIGLPFEDKIFEAKVNQNKPWEN